MTFYFDPNVWGTVSDWTIAAITLITAYYLYKTLKSQNDVQRMQAKLLEIESVKFAESIKPKLRFTIAKANPFEAASEDKKIYTVDMINESESVALEISVESADTANAKRVLIATDFPRIHQKKEDKPWKIHFVTENNQRFPQFVTFMVFFQDISGAKYKQGGLAILDGEHSEIHHFLQEKV
jgi:hypothetical protein